MKLVEVVKAEDSSAETVALAKAFGMRLGKTTVVTNDGPGFVVNRVLSPYMKEAFTLLLEGVPLTTSTRLPPSSACPWAPLL
jgi:3-hydroxyacyl-CoA dehydrogenase